MSWTDPIDTFNNVVDPNRVCPNSGGNSVDCGISSSVAIVPGCNWFCAMRHFSVHESEFRRSTTEFVFTTATLPPSCTLKVFTSNSTGTGVVVGVVVGLQMLANLYNGVPDDACATLVAFIEYRLELSIPITVFHLVIWSSATHCIPSVVLHAVLDDCSRRLRLAVGLGAIEKEKTSRNALALAGVKTHVNISLNTSASPAVILETNVATVANDGNRGIEYVAVYETDTTSPTQWSRLGELLH